MTVSGGVVLSHVSVLKRLGARCNLLVPLNDCDLCDWVQDATYLSLSMTVTCGVVLSHVSVLKRLVARCNLLVPLNDCDCGVVVTCFCTKATGCKINLCPLNDCTVVPNKRLVQDATYLSLSMTVSGGVVLSHVSVLKRLGARCNLLVPLNDCDLWCGPVTCFCTKATGCKMQPTCPSQ
ncbi:hypothetical protein J6590_001521 [Homalodisca vitripennis]|nr:hypothetical protein J6590_001521 [Homalodisca vitripennis]